MYYYLILCLIGLLLLLNGYRYLCRKLELRRRLALGRIGEQQTIKELKKLRGYKRILRNLYVPMGTGTTEIDAVILHGKGILVIENKNYTGAIYGKEADSQWTQTYRKNGKQESRQFYNPVKQNQTHIRCLKKFLTSADLKKLSASQKQKLSYVSVITFNDRAVLKQISIKSKDILVSESKFVRQRLDKKLYFQKRVLNRKQIDELYGQLRKFENPGRRVKKQHIQQVKKSS